MKRISMGMQKYEMPIRRSAIASPFMFMLLVVAMAVLDDGCSWGIRLREEREENDRGKKSKGQAISKELCPVEAPSPSSSSAALGAPELLIASQTQC